MSGYITVGTHNLHRAAAFYNALLAILGVKRIMGFGRGIAWSVSPATPGFGVVTPCDGRPAAHGNGNMVAFATNDKAIVDAFYKKALEIGATNEGPPGPRGDGFYAAYCRDLGGDKFNAFYMGA
jgi:hypothetical protein